MTRWKTRIAAVLVAVPVIAGLTAVPAGAADPTTPFLAVGDGGSASGNYTWYNRSVKVQGSVHDAWPSSTVEFVFYAGSTWLDTQTRTVTGGPRSFNFTEPGPRGGITDIDLFLCENNVCNYYGVTRRP
jgi:hypothetical protein